MDKSVGEKEMKKFLFLEYKFRDFSDEELEMPIPTGVIASLEKLNKGRWEQVKRIFREKGISFVSLPGEDICPASRAAEKFLVEKIKKALSYQPDCLWFDHLRFEGHWEVKTKTFKGVHYKCKFCKGKSRSEIITNLAKRVLRRIPKNIKVGYFAVPFKAYQNRNLVKVLGQNHQQLGEIFDCVSPMLYQRMIGKPVSYIAEYVKYLSSLKIKAKIIPIIQLKDMPDNFADKLTVSEIKKEIQYAIRPPSEALAVFSWDQAIEKGKLEAVSEILKTLR